MLVIMDVLTDVVRTLGPSGMVLACGRYPHPFGVSLDGSSEAGFHLIVEGACWLRREGAAPLQLLQGDLVLLPRGDAHALCSTPEGAAAPLSELRRLPMPPLPAGAPATTVLCGAYCLGAPLTHPLLLTLPRTLHLPAKRVREHAGLAGVLDLITREVSGAQSGAQVGGAQLAGARLDAPAGAAHAGAQTYGAQAGAPQVGSDEVLRHLIDLLLHYVLRTVASEEGERGWLGALSDPVVGAALRLLHGDPAHDWTVEELARRVGASRAALGRRFTEAVGEPPLAYLTRWRMSRAAALLRGSEASVHEIAGQVGYQSEFAFSRAFKRVLGSAPTSYRRAG